MNNWIELVSFMLIALVGLWRLPRLAFVKNSGLSSNTIRTLLLVKVLISLLFAWYVFQLETPNDYLFFNAEGLKEYQLLQTHPTQYMDAFSLDAQHYGWKNLLGVDKSFWANASFGLVYKTLGLFNLITLGNFFTNTLLFSFFTFLGMVALYRAFVSIYSENTALVQVSCFLLPSTLVYTACVHKDGFVFVGIAFITYLLASFEKQSKHYRWIKYVLLVACLLLVGLFRSFVLMILIPAGLAWWISGAIKKRTIPIFLSTYLITSVLFFCSAYWSSQLNLPEAVVQRKQAFEKLPQGFTRIEMQDLQPTIGSFLHNLPQALNHSLLRPYVCEYNSWSIRMAGLEMMIYASLIVLCVFFFKKTITLNHRLVWFGLFVFIGMMLMIGYTIPNIGAIVRYRSIFWVFAICPVLCSIDWTRIKTMFARA
jgi:hypothetical protein